MKIIKVLENTELVVVDLEVNLGKEKRNGLTLCVKYLSLIHISEPTRPY